ncbi:MAG: type II toxin-antitoxin system RelE/ParE family toxin [Gammaproteobacteria bacterium]|nr:type II toxin-antitoxin system RelE/ParE family toxin [Gammaproteobacteria bacterium]
MRVEFHPRAEEEFIEEAAYYEEQVAGLGEAFIMEIESAANLLEDHPKIGAEFESVFRHLPARRFPHSLIYTIKTRRIWVLAVAHQSRRPGYWRERSDR